MLAAFEAQNQVRIDICLTSSVTDDTPDLCLTGKAWRKDSDRRAAKPLACQSVTCRRERVRSVEGVVTYLLYQLDFLLAEYEWESAGNK